MRRLPVGPPNYDRSRTAFPKSPHRCPSSRVHLLPADAAPKHVPNADSDHANAPASTHQTKKCSPLRSRSNRRLHQPLHSSQTYSRRGSRSPRHHESRASTFPRTISDSASCCASPTATPLQANESSPRAKACQTNRLPDAKQEDRKSTRLNSSHVALSR